MRRLKWGLLAVAATLAACAVVRYWPRPPLATLIPTSRAVVDAEGRLLRLTLARDQQYRLWTPLEQVSPQFVEALLLHEDRQFFRHPGVNPVALVRAALATYGGGTRQGGSTLTMQLARLLYDLNTQTPLGKLRQVAFAVGLELRYSKHDLLEAHINLLPYGANIQGLGAASLIYFSKAPDQLSLPEALTLVLIPQSPRNRAPAQGEPQGLRAARSRLFAAWLARHPEAVTDAGLVELPLRYRGSARLPFAAPHLTDMLLRAAPEGRVSSTLDAGLQSLLEGQLSHYLGEQARIGIRNACAMLVDTRSMEVKALLGSAGFWNAAIQGQVNGVLAKRSPGSALKPLIYGLAIDQGLIHSHSMLKDAPTAFGPFSPENFDGQFVGPISAREALVRSRNVPAVALSARLANPSFYQFLKDAGVAHMASEQHYGLALALGGGEVTMEEAIRLYAMLANRGVLKSLRYRKDDLVDAGTRLLSEEASFMVLDMLRNNPRPDDPFLQPRGRLPVAWKTGTSWGFRDAWTIGIFGPYVLAVWVGNFDGPGNPAFVGIRAAAPLFFRMTDAIQATHPELHEPVFTQPPRLLRVPVCAASGDLPNADCPQLAEAWFIPGRSPIRVSQIHRRIAVDVRTGKQACAPLDPDQVKWEVFEFWPSDIQRLFSQAGMPRKRPPPPGDCAQSEIAGVAPSITSPLTGAAYTVRATRLGRDTVPLSANADADVRSLYWFVDESFVGAGRPGIAHPWTPAQAGRFTVRSVDDHGRADSRELRVVLVP